MRTRRSIRLSYSWFDIAGLAGVVLIIIAYLLLQLGKLPSTAPSYSLLNAIGAFLVMVSLFFDFNLSAFLMEAFWFLISLFGLLRPWFSRTVVANR
ncbi:MAG TPA: hypothetical protein VFV61_03170 [Pyrinomonadaceae bacterium]|nr:hypothetical protein [Pyrinomonadaceae bacterium]